MQVTAGRIKARGLDLAGLARVRIYARTVLAQRYGVRKANEL
jgi:hypothetical protein